MTIRRLLFVLLIATLDAPARAASFQDEMERAPLTAEQEATLNRVILDRAWSSMAKLGAAKTDRDQFYALPGAAVGAFYLKRFPMAGDLARRSLATASAYRGDWNYGNALHYGHTVLGLLALQEGDTQRAVEELHKAGETPGSPQLDSFGPSMQLAKALLKAGQSQPVLDYLEQCRVFWKMGEPWLTIWRDKIRAGGVPNFPHESLVSGLMEAAPGRG